MNSVFKKIYYFYLRKKTATVGKNWPLLLQYMPKAAKDQGLSMNTTEEIVKIKALGAAKLNNAEYSNFASRFITLILDAISEANAAVAQETPTETPPEASSEVIGIPAEDFKAYQQEMELMKEILGHNRISSQTYGLTETDRKRDDLVSSILGTIKAAKKSALEWRHEAGVVLYNEVHTYFGCQNWPKQQETSAVRAMVTDLRKEKNVGHMATLGLTDDLNALEEINQRYAELTAERLEERVANKIERSRKVRQRMNRLYDHMTTLAFVKSVAFPTELTSKFVANLNAVIDEINELYNRRMAERKPK